MANTFNAADAASRLILLMANAGGAARDVLTEALQAAYDKGKNAGIAIAQTEDDFEEPTVENERI